MIPRMFRSKSNVFQLSTIRQLAGIISGISRALNNKLLTDFLFAGSSAWFMAVSYVYADFQYLAYFSLVPFLWRAMRVSLKNAMILGGILAICWYFVMTPYIGWATAIPVFLRFPLILCLFVAYATAVNLTARRIGRCALLLALLWLPVEYLLFKSFGGVFTFVNAESGLLLRFGALFGVLITSLTIVLVNTFILFIFEQSVLIELNPAGFNIGCCRIKYFTYEIILIKNRYLVYPDLRAPPPALMR